MWYIPNTIDGLVNETGQKGVYPTNKAQTERTKAFVSGALSVIITVAPFTNINCNYHPGPPKSPVPATSSRNEYRKEFEGNIYSLVSKIITESKPSDMGVFKGDDSVTYCTKEAATLLEGIIELMGKGKYPEKWPNPVIPHEMDEIQNSEGFYVTLLKNPENLANNIAIEFVYINHPELDDVVFCFEGNGNEVEITLGIQGGDYGVVYKKDDKTVKRFSGNPDLYLPFEEIVGENEIQKYYDLVKQIQEKFTLPSHN